MSEILCPKCGHERWLHMKCSDGYSVCHETECTCMHTENEIDLLIERDSARQVAADMLRKRREAERDAEDQYKRAERWAERARKAEAQLAAANAEIAKLKAPPVILECDYLECNYDDSTTICPKCGTEYVAAKDGEG